MSDPCSGCGELKARVADLQMQVGKLEEAMKVAQALNDYASNLQADKITELQGELDTERRDTLHEAAKYVEDLAELEAWSAMSSSLYSIANLLRTQAKEKTSDG